MPVEYRIGSTIVDLDTIDTGVLTYQQVWTSAVDEALIGTGWERTQVLDVQSTTSDWRPNEYRVFFVACRTNIVAQESVPHVRWGGK